MTRFQDLLLHEASTRPAALIRIGLALLIWTRFAADIAPWSHHPIDPLLRVLFFGATTGMLLGWFARVSTALTGVVLWLMVYIVGPVSMEPWTHHHTTLLAHATLLLALAPCGQSYSVDRWRAVQRGEAEPERGPTWALTLIAVQLTVMYLSTAIDKATLAFLSGERLQHAFHTLYWGADPVTVPGFALICMLSAWVVFVLELALPVGMWLPRARPILVPLAIVMHLIFWLALPVGTFSLTTLLLYLAWFDADAVHRALDRLQGSPIAEPR